MNIRRVIRRENSVKGFMIKEYNKFNISQHDSVGLYSIVIVPTHRMYRALLLIFIYFRFI